MASLLQRFRKTPVRRLDWADTDIQSTTERYLLFVLVPLWIVPGLLDWYWHKQTKIEDTSGLKESLIHSLMMTEVGAPILMSLLFEINPLALSLTAGALVAHSATAIWDVSLAVHHREVTTREQHTHSFLEVLPFMGLAFIACLHGDAMRRLLTGKTKPGDWQLQLKTPRLPIPYLAGIVGLIAVGVWWPYTNEIRRCVQRLRAPKRNTGFYKDTPLGEPDVRNC
ncbi:MAG: diguanylate cyclase [Janthinobacterium lividum]